MYTKNIKLISLALTTVMFIVGCTVGEEEELDSIVGIVEVDSDFYFEDNGIPLLAFQPEHMRVINEHNFNGELPFPFEPERVYENYNILYTDETLTIEVEDIAYELEIMGPRIFRDNESGIVFSTRNYLFDYVE